MKNKPIALAVVLIFSLILLAGCKTKEDIAGEAPYTAKYRERNKTITVGCIDCSECEGLAKDECVNKGFCKQGVLTDPATGWQITVCDADLKCSKETGRCERRCCRTCTNLNEEECAEDERCMAARGRDGKFTNCLKRPPCVKLSERECLKDEKCMAARDSKGNFMKCDPRASKCNLAINGISFGITDSWSECESFFLALSFNNRIDFSRLLKVAAPAKIPYEKIINETNNVSIFYKENATYEFFTDTRKKFVSGSCEEIYFLGIKLFCFNEVTGKKNNSLQYIIPGFTVIRYTSNLKHLNLLTGQQTTAYDFILGNGVEYYDGSNPLLYGETLKSTKCFPSSANYQNRNGRSVVFICEQTLREEISAAGMLYHEAVHKYQIGHFYDVNCSIISDAHTDKDFKSVYGAQIEYLFSMSQNDVFSCDERQIAFDMAEGGIRTRLCSHPEHNYSRPRCTIDEINCGNLNENECINDEKCSPVRNRAGKFIECGVRPHCAKLNETECINDEKCVLARDENGDFMGCYLNYHPKDKQTDID